MTVPSRACGLGPREGKPTHIPAIDATGAMKKGDLIHSYCQVIGTGDDGSSPCLIVSVEQAPRYSGGQPTENKILRRYLFNVGEGTQRFCGEASVKLGKVNKLFLTGTGAEEHAGLSGLILTLSALGSPVLEVFGPSGVDKLVEGLQAFGPRVGRCPTVSPMPLPLGPGESQCSYVLGDENMEVRCGVVDPSRVGLAKKAVAVDTSSEDSSSSSSSCSSSSSSSSGDDESSSSEDNSDEGKREGEGDGGKRERERESKQGSSSSGCGRGGVGDCNVSEKQRATGAKRLRSTGETTAMSRGGASTVDRSKGARYPTKPSGIPARGPAVLYHCRVLHGDGATFLVLSCPNVAYVPAIRSHTIVRGAKGKDSVLFVFHFSPEDVVDDPAYAPLLGLEGTHVLLGYGGRGRQRGAGGLQHRKLAERSVQLHFVAPQAFPLHSALLNKAGGMGGAAAADSFSSPNGSGNSSGSTTVVAHTLSKAVLLPAAARGIDLSAVRPPVEVLEVWEDMEQRVEEAGLRDERDRIVATLWAANGLSRESVLPGAARGSMRESMLPGDSPVSDEEDDLDAAVSTTWSGSGASGSGSGALPKRLSSFLPAPPPLPPLYGGGPPGKRARTGNNNTPLAQNRLPCPPPPPRVPLFSGGGLAGAEVFFLGTGSAAPTKNRGCSGILLRVPQGGLASHGRAAEGRPLRLLIDAGEGTLGHLVRQFGREGALREIQGLDCVWISHKHADHHTGLFRLIVEHNRARQASRLEDRGSKGIPAPLVVVAPSAVLTFINACKEFSGEDISYEAMSCKDIERPAHWRGGDGGGRAAGGSRHGASFLLSGMRSVPVIHCREAYGLVLQLWQNGAKLVYSGDTRPCDRLVRAGAGAALLIHEATFDDSMQQDAVSKMHCTTSEALEVGRRMRAGEVVLTHFSQRYPRVPVLDTERTQHFCVAFDGMVLNSTTVGILPAAANLLSQVLEPKTEEEKEDYVELA